MSNDQPNLLGFLNLILKMSFLSLGNAYKVGYAEGYQAAKSELVRVDSKELTN